ncbi:MAG: maleylacetoacetate isomerase [Pseudomonadota bacterium]
MSEKPVLYDYWRSSASYRVRIALNLLGLEYDSQQIDLLSAEHRGADYLKVNPQGILPALRVDGFCLTQSLAIIEYLHATTTGSTLLPDDAAGQARVRQLSYAIAMEIHPICNLRVARHVTELTGGGEAEKRAWMQHYIARGLDAQELLLAQGRSGRFAHGDTPTMADCCLIPQLYNSDRWGVDYTHHAMISEIAEAARGLDAFARAHPDQIGPPGP